MAANDPICIRPVVTRAASLPFGLKFKKMHFGWARVKLSINAHTRAIATTLTGYAFETIPGKAIITGATKGPDDIEPNASFGMPTPEPATLSALAMEAPGLSIRRRKETVLVDD
jgi:hypothetical protein